MRKLLLVVTVVGLALAGLGVGLYLGNAAPVVPAVSAAEAALGGKPYVVKLHAQWCANCMITKRVWSEIEQVYTGRVHLVVLDFTSDANTEASRVEAARLGLQDFYEEYGGATGVVAVLDGRTKEVKASIAGSRDFEAYRRAIDEALAASRPAP